MNQRSPTPSWILPPPVRNFREHLREIRRVAGETQGQLLQTHAAVSDRAARLGELVRDHSRKLERIERQLGELGASESVASAPAGESLPAPAGESVASAPAGYAGESATPAPAGESAAPAPARQTAPAPPPTRRAKSFDYDAAVSALVSAGVPEPIIRWGSIWPESLAHISETIRRELPSDRPAVALHVGNFLGISLAGIASVLCEMHPGSLTIGVDPGAAIAGIAHPQDHVVQLLDHFDLTRNVLLVCGYSFGRTTPDSTDAVPQASFDAWMARERPGEASPNLQDGTSGAERDGHPPASCENVLPLLAQLDPRYDVALLDGHHGEETLAAELRYLGNTLRERGLVFIDDAHDEFPGIRDLFRDPGDGFEQAGHDGRVGVLRLVR